MQAEEDRQLGVRIGNQVATEVRPQLFATGDRVQVFASDRDGLNELIRFVDKQIEHGRLARTRVFIAEDIKEARFLMHRSDDAVVSCSSAERAHEFLGNLQKQWSEIKSKIQTTEERRLTHENPNIVISMTM